MKEVILDCRDGITAIHDRLARELAFPEWYGRNLDALFDCLTDLAEDVSVTLLYPELLPGLTAVLNDAAADNPLIHLQIIVE